MTIDWQHLRTVPRFASAVLSALRFDNPDVSGLQLLSSSEWTRALDFCDKAHLTLALNRVAGESLPA